MLSMTACAPPPLPTDTGKGGDDSAQVSDAPTIRIIYPVSTSSTVYCPSFFMAVDVDGFTLTTIQDEPVNVDGEGHWHVKSDGTYVMAVDKEYIQVPVSEKITAGTHYISAQLATNDHQPLDPNVEHSIEITIGDTQSDGVTPCAGGPDSPYEGDSGDTGDTGVDMGY